MKRSIFGFIFLLFLCVSSRAQVYDLACPAGSSPVPQSMQTSVPSTGHLRANTCVDANGIMTYQAAGSTVSSSACGPGCITPAQLYAVYGAKFDVSVAPTADASTTNGSAIITCPDCKFITGTFPAKVGQFIKATDSTGATQGANTCLDNPTIQFGGANFGTIASVDSDTQIHANANAGATSVALACLGWGDDDTAAINSAWAAGGCTAAMTMPLGKAFISAPVAQAIAGCVGVFQSGNGYQGQRMMGSSLDGTYLVPINFNASSISGSGGGTAPTKSAIGNPNIAEYGEFNVWGLGERAPAALANTTLWLVGTATRWINANCVGWYGRGGGATLSGVSVSGGTDIAAWGGSNFCGSSVLTLINDNLYLGNGFFSGNPFSVNGTCPVTIIGQSAFPNTTINSVGNYIIGCMWFTGNNSTFNSMNSVFQNPGGDANSISFNSGVTGNTLNLLANDTVNSSPAANSSGIFYGSGTGNRVNAKYSTINANGTGVSINLSANDTFNDSENNTFVGGAGAWNGLGNWIGTGSGLKPQVAVNFADGTGLGTSTFTLSGNPTALHGQVTVTYAGTLTTTPSFTMTFPTGSFIATPACTLTDIGGTNPFPTQIANGATSTSSVVFNLTFAVAPTAGNTDIFVWNCSN